jgi:hypothetical protein
MMSYLVAGIWACLVTLGAVYGSWSAQMAKLEGDHSPKVSVDVRKTRSLSVPIIADGKVNGYILAQFTYAVDTAQASSIQIAPEIYILDEAFKAIYSDPDLDFRHLERYDVKALTKRLVSEVNARMNAKVLADVLIEEFAYIGKSDIQK